MIRSFMNRMGDSYYSSEAFDGLSLLCNFCGAISSAEEMSFRSDGGLRQWGFAMDMPIAVTVPDFKTGEMPLRISAWFVDPGDAVEEGDRLFEILLPGITCDVASTCAGTLLRIDKAIDADVHIGETVAWIEPSSGSPA